MIIKKVKTVESIVIENNCETLLIGGDFKNVLNIELDKLNRNTNTHKKCSTKINDIINNNELYDIYRLKYPDKKTLRLGILITDHQYFVGLITS